MKQELNITDRVKELENTVYCLKINLDNLILAHSRTVAEVEELNNLADHEPSQSVTGMRVVSWYEPGHKVVEPSAEEIERNKVTAAAVAEAEGFVILSDDLKEKIGQDAVTAYLNSLDLQGALELVQYRIPRGVNSLEVSK